MKLHSIDIVHSDDLNSVLARDKLVAEKIKPWKTNSGLAREKNYSELTNKKVGHRFPDSDCAILSSKANLKAYLRVNPSVGLSSAETISALPKLTDFESNLLEKNYQPDYFQSLQKRVGLKILIIEDDDLSRARLGKILHTQNFQVIEAKDSNTGIKLAKAELPNLIICELMMPIMDGYGVMYWLRHSNITQKIPLLFITTHLEQTNMSSKRILITEKDKIEPVTREKLLEAITNKLVQ